VNSSDDDDDDHPQRGHPASDRGVYGISLTAELSGSAVQSLRLWERHGLLTPDRSDGGTRRYSADDLDRISRVMELVALGVNIAGIGRILDLEDANAALQAVVDDRNGSTASGPPPPNS